MRVRKPHVTPSFVISCLALFVALGGTAYAATGGTFILGQANSATSGTGLTSKNAGKTLNLTQQSPKAAATALGLNVPVGRPPFMVNSNVRVDNLNADLIDGVDGSQIVRATGWFRESALTLADCNAPTTFATAPVTVPADGVMIVNASVTVARPAGTGLIGLAARIDHDFGGGVSPGMWQEATVQGDARANLAPTTMIPVSPGNHTFILTVCDGDHTTTDGLSTKALRGEMTLVFTSFRL
jgi:hypothetical protein